jgi:lipopolysaccharide/colanic/teichoic acid biosynthesis glycosyltransferase
MYLPHTLARNERAVLREPRAARSIDLALVLLLGTFALPILVAAALAIWLEGGGPVLYRQTRIGLNGRPFQMLKLRSMRSDAEADGVARWAGEADPRITRVGRLLRRTRIDELPQLWNVLRGDMRVIGPRPERPAFVDSLSRQIRHYHLRHCVKPGITGWAQVRDGYAASVAAAARKLEHDLYYVRNQCLRLDLRILLETVAVVLGGSGGR